MKYLLIMLLFVTTQAFAGGQLQQQLKESPQMSEKCMTNISYYKSKIFDYELKVHLSVGQKIKLHYYRSELDAWEEYCSPGDDDPDNPDNF